MEQPVQPPVNEVVLSIRFARQSALTGPLLPDILGDWFRAHANVQSVPAYQMPQESPEFGGLLPRPQIQVMGSIPEPRYWLTSPDDGELVQVQQDYIGLNWRRRDVGDEYVGYTYLKQRFLDLLSTLDVGLKRHGGMLQPLQEELTYVNLVTPNELWSSHSETHRIFKFSAPEIGYEHASFAYSRMLIGEFDFRGRVHVSLQPTFEWAKRQPQLNLNITARSVESSEASLEESIKFLDDAHEEAGRVFIESLTPDARRIWGFS